MRRPFPGPGLLLRFGGEYTMEKLRLIRLATKIVDEFLKKYSKIFVNCYQMFPYLVSDEPVTYINQKGKGNLGKILVIRAVKQKLVTGKIVYEPFAIPMVYRTDLTKQLMNISGIARVCFDHTSKYGAGDKVKPGATIEYI
jgi:GMP synthase (glutamine-hydrolysing)